MLQAQNNLFELTSHLAAAYAAFEQQHTASQDRLAEAALLEKELAQQQHSLAQHASISQQDGTEVSS